jgi:hypothetical protein
VKTDGDRYVTERHWPPSDAEVIHLVEQEVRIYRDTFESAVALMTAEVALTPAERKGVEKTGEGQS